MNHSELNLTNSHEEINGVPQIIEEHLENQGEFHIIEQILFILLLLVISIYTNNFIKSKKVKYLNESVITILISAIGAFILTNYFQMDQFINDVTKSYVSVFLIFLLPPIIFESAYSIKTKEFYKNLGSLMIYAVLGTVISILFIGYMIYQFGESGYIQKFNISESLAYGAIISATDPVCILSAFKEYTTDPNFFLLVFGESILNDAVSMVFYDTVVETTKNNDKNTNILGPSFKFLFILFGSTIVGWIIGFLTSALLKKFIEKDNEKIEIGVMLILPWAAYLVSYVLGLSSIVVIFFLGIAHAIYTKPYISPNSRIIIKHIYEEVAAIFEMVVFIYIGIAYFSDLGFKSFNFSFAVLVIILCLIGRFLNIIICTYLNNIPRSSQTKIDNPKQFFLWFAGVRGAMAFALSIKSKVDFPNAGSTFLIVTLVITAFTLIYASLLLEYTLNQCNIILKESPVEMDDKLNDKYQNSNNFFNQLKSRFKTMNEELFMPYVKREEQFESTKSRLLTDQFNK